MTYYEVRAMTICQMKAMLYRATLLVPYLILMGCVPASHLPVNVTQASEASGGVPPLTLDSTFETPTFSAVMQEFENVGGAAITGRLIEGYGRHAPQTNVPVW